LAILYSQKKAARTYKAPRECPKNIIVVNTTH
jgi:hypothetical protein